MANCPLQQFINFAHSYFANECEETDLYRPQIIRDRSGNIVGKRLYFAGNDQLYNWEVGFNAEETGYVFSSIAEYVPNLKYYYAWIWGEFNAPATHVYDCMAHQIDLSLAVSLCLTL